MSGPTALPPIIFLVLRAMRTPLIVLILAYSISITGFLLIPGTLPDGGGEWRMDFLHAFYFVSYMGTTIGFGELPYPFNGAQRLWTLFTIYSTVISWLYAIGTMISLLQNREFLLALARSQAQRRVARLKDDFYLLCGYGEAGKVVTRFLGEVGLPVVVVDKNPSEIAELNLGDPRSGLYGICADAADPEQLENAGLTHARCKGVIAVVGDDQENLKIAISAKLLNRRVKVIGRVNKLDTADNMRSFGTDHILNPFKTFAWHFGLAFHSPGLHLLNDWLSQTQFQQLNEPVFPPVGKWILCSYGRFGKALYEKLTEHGNEVVVIDQNPETMQAPEGTIVGRGTEAVTLKHAGIRDAVGIIAGTDHDANNLSILVTAKALKPSLFTVGRQNQDRNAPLFDAANLDVVINQNRLIANRVISLLTTPLTTQFLRLANEQDSEWSNLVVSRISAVVEKNAPLSWVIDLSGRKAPAFINQVRNQRTTKLGALSREPYHRRNRLACVPLMVKRGKQSILVPEDDLVLQAGDRILFCGNVDARRKMLSTVSNNSLMNYVVTGQHSAESPIWQWLSQRVKSGRQ